MRSVMSALPTPFLGLSLLLVNAGSSPLAAGQSTTDAPVLYELTGARVYHVSGSTENTAWSTMNKAKPWLEANLLENERWELQKRQGLEVPGCDVKIVDSNGNELPHDGTLAGELLLRGPWVMSSYYKAPEMSDRFTDDGYWRSGDVQ